MQHVPAFCNVADCHNEASYWLDTSNGFSEPLLATVEVPETFYLCSEHMTDIVNDETGDYVHLRVDTGVLEHIEIASYSCSEECDECNA